MKVGEDGRVVNKTMCSLEGSYSSEGSEKEAFQRCTDQHAQTHGRACSRQRRTLCMLGV